MTRPSVVAATWLAAGLAPFTPAPAAGQQGPLASVRPAARLDSGGSPGAVPNETAVAVRVRQDVPRVDGRLDDAAWTLASVLGDFVQRDPDEGQPATQRTEARVLYTDDAIYVGVRAFDTEAARVVGHLTRRDQDSPSDWIGVGIASYNDKRTAFVFYVNPAGVKRDLYYFNDTQSDASWDAVWDVATSMDGEGWIAEFRIPFSQLRFAPADSHTFGFQVLRSLSRRNEVSHWHLVPRNASGQVSLWGELTGLQGLRPPRRLEVLPYSVARLERTRPNAANPFNDGRTLFGSGGADVKYGLTSNITLDMAINPDFGQVEQDPAFVNLSAFEQFQSERRPFFTEGVNIFSSPLGSGSGGSEQLFYSRRIGRSPQGWADPQGGYAEQVTSTTILGAAKLSGRMPSGWTVGLLAALTSEEEAEIQTGASQRLAATVEPRTTYLVGRLARDLRQGHTVIGVFGTALRRDLPASMDWLRDGAYSGALDVNHRFRSGRYRFAGRLSASHVRGSTEAITATQLSPARAFQRPDNDYRDVDSSATSLTGYAAAASLNDEDGSWRWSLGYDGRSPEFEVNDMGFVREVDYHQQWSWLQRRWMTPGKVFRRMFVNLNQWTRYTYGGDRLSAGGNVNANWQFLNYWGGYAGIEQDIEGLNRNELRGGPMIRRPPSTNLWYGAYSDSRKRLSVEAGGWGFQQRDNDSRGWGVYQYLRFRPTTSVELSVGPNFDRSHDDWLYLATVTTPSGTEYVLSETDFSTIRASLRANLTFSPTLTLQAYVEPFYSTVRRTTFKLLADPRAATYAGRFAILADSRVQRDPQTNEVALDVDGDASFETNVGNPDFAYTSLRSNVVLRWEYRPGSTVFLVWQQGREAVGADGRFRMRDVGSNIVDARPSNVFLVKVNYWLSL